MLSLILRSGNLTNLTNLTKLSQLRVLSQSTQVSWPVSIDSTNTSNSSDHKESNHSHKETPKQASKDSSKDSSKDGSIDVVNMAVTFGPLTFKSSVTYDPNNSLNSDLFDRTWGKKTTATATGNKMNPMELYNGIFELLKTTGNKMSQVELYNRLLELLKTSDKKLYDFAIYCKENQSYLHRTYFTIATLGLFPAFYSMSGYFQHTTTLVMAYAICALLLHASGVGLIALTESSRYNVLIVLIVIGAIAYGVTREYKPPTYRYNGF